MWGLELAFGFALERLVNFILVCSEAWAASGGGEFDASFKWLSLQGFCATFELEHIGAMYGTCEKGQQVYTAGTPELIWLV